MKGGDVIDTAVFTNTTVARLSQTHDGEYDDDVDGEYRFCLFLV